MRQVPLDALGWSSPGKDPVWKLLSKGCHELRTHPPLTPLLLHGCQGKGLCLKPVHTALQSRVALVALELPSFFNLKYLKFYLKNKGESKEKPFKL